MDRHHSLSSNRHHDVLELCLRDILAWIKPSENDHLRRLHTIDELSTIVRSVRGLKDVVVRPFGSFISNLHTRWGDLDISVEITSRSPSSTSKRHKQNVLRDIMRALQRKGFAQNLNFISSARVPLLVFESNRHNVSCDVSIDNHIGWMKSRILLLMSEIDERFRDMVLLTKEWAKAHDINNPKSGTLNSYSLCLLVIFHFQTCKPAILPPLKDIYDGNLSEITGTWSTLERQIEDTCAANIARFKSFRQRNRSTLCELLISFFDKFSHFLQFSRAEQPCSEYGVCTYSGQWERKGSNPRWMEHAYRLVIEDPFERPDNAARAVNLEGLISISQEFTETYRELSSQHVLSDRNALLTNLVRPSIRSHLKVETHTNYTINQIQEKPRTEYFINQLHFAPAHGRSHGVARVDRHSQPSPSTVTRHSQYYTTVKTQQEWRPRVSNG